MMMTLLPTLIEPVPSVEVEVKVELGETRLIGTHSHSKSDARG